MQVEYISVNDIKPYEKNAKKHPEQQIEHIANSIKEFGWQQPIVVDKDNVVVIGHGRLLAAKKLNMDSVPCVRADDLTDEQIKALRLADNKTNESEWDFDLLDMELSDIEIDMEQFGFGFDIPIDDCQERTEKIQTLFFDNETIINKIIDGWQTYQTLDSYVKNIIDEPTAMYQYNRLCQGYDDGYNISLLFNPHRLNVDTLKYKSIFYAINNDDKYKRQFARYIVSMNKVVPPSLYYKHITIGHAGYQYVNEFPPYIARDIYMRFCSHGDKILNPCAGWGGRLIGLSACDFENIEYVEVEPCAKTFEGLQKIKNWLKLGDNYKQIFSTFEAADLPSDYFDFVFTSPPYFNTEKYSDEDTQSYKNKKIIQNGKSNFFM